METKQFKDKVVLVTGGSRGIGKAIVEAFSLQGALVIANYNKSENEASELVNKLKASCCAVESYKADVTKGKEVEKMIDDIVIRHGKIDILVNNAGLKKDAFLALMGDDDWDRVIEGNLKSVYYVTKWVSRAMMRQRNGKIINVSSLSALKGLAGQTNYAAAKGGVVSFTRAAAQELARFNIQVNAVAPGLIGTEMIEGMDKQALDSIVERIPLGRIGAPQDVAQAVLFLASSAGDYITGETLLVDGGLGI